MQSLHDHFALLKIPFQECRYLKTLYEHDGCIGTLSTDLYYHPLSELFVIANMNKGTTQHIRIVQCKNEIADYSNLLNIPS